ncbi:uncharacterized protein LOC107006340 [Solanum pennellii]|uniref:Uncharacterized protein LOC107006340 n=1 Tax=Solanum pennellii TaxID=28526 RepID=A0ABM1FQV8_SOLPN|nr:uncharacterized protein LOC107006340 [Solanum pennellii]
MGATDTKKDELAFYQLKNVAQTWCKIWQDREMREAKVKECINLKQGSMTVRDYSLKFVKMSSYDTFLVSNNRDEMSRFLTGITGDLEEKCRDAMLPNNMDLSRLMVHVHQVEDNQKKGGVSDARKPKTYDQAGPSNCGNRNNFGVCEQPKFKKGHRVQGNNACFGCGKNGHMVKECPQRRGKTGGNAQPTPNPQGTAVAEPPKRNNFYALKVRKEQEKSANVVTGSTLFFVTSLLALTLEIFPEFLHDPIVVGTILG